MEFNYRHHLAPGPPAPAPAPAPASPAPAPVQYQSSRPRPSPKPSHTKHNNQTSVLRAASAVRCASAAAYALHQREHSATPTFLSAAKREAMAARSWVTVLTASLSAAMRLCRSAIVAASAPPVGPSACGPLSGPAPAPAGPSAASPSAGAAAVLSVVSWSIRVRAADDEATRLFSRASFSFSSDL